MKPPRGLRCPHPRPDGQPCDRKVGNEVVGVYRTDCPRCGRPVEFVGDGQATVTDRDGRPVEVRAEVVPPR